MNDWLGAWQQGRARQNLRRDALRAAAARCDGKSRAEAESIITDELRARHLPVPADQVMDLMVDRVMSDGDIVGQARLVARGLGAAVTLGAQVVQEATDRIRAMGPNLNLGDQEPLFIDADRSAPEVPVALSADGQSWLTSSGAVGFSEIFVLLRPDSAQGRLAVEAGDRLIGTLSLADSAVYQPFMETAQSEGRPVVGEAALRRSADAAATVHLYRPRPDHSR